MKTVLVMLVATAMVVAMAGTASADLEAGLFEVGGMFALNNYQADEGDMDVTFIHMEGVINYFLSDVFSLGLILDVRNVDSDAADDDVTIYGISVRGDYYFMSSGPAIPYVGIRAGTKGYEVGDADDSEGAFGAQGGVKLSVAENTFVNLEGVFETMETSSDDLQRFSFMAGISFTF
jgi:opacity protein-like surface antigen